MQAGYFLGSWLLAMQPWLRCVHTRVSRMAGSKDPIFLAVGVLVWRAAGGWQDHQSADLGYSGAGAVPCHHQRILSWSSGSAAGVRHHKVRWVPALYLHRSVLQCADAHAAVCCLCTPSSQGGSGGQQLCLQRKQHAAPAMQSTGTSRCSASRLHQKRQVLQAASLLPGCSRSIETPSSPHLQGASLPSAIPVICSLLCELCADCMSACCFPLVCVPPRLLAPLPPRLLTCSEL